MTKPTQKIKKLWEDKTGVSPIIAVILMVAITVVLAATIYVWVSGFGGGGDQTPAVSISRDNVNDQWMVTNCDTGVNWTDISIKASSSVDANLTCNAVTSDTAFSIDNTFNQVGTDIWTGLSGDLTMSAGDTIALTSGSGTISITLRYEPTNAVLGTWTLTV